jgi:hypothetical protein
MVDATATVLVFQGLHIPWLKGFETSLLNPTFRMTFLELQEKTHLQNTRTQPKRWRLVQKIREHERTKMVNRCRHMIQMVHQAFCGKLLSTKKYKWVLYIAEYLYFSILCAIEQCIMKVLEYSRVSWTSTPSVLLAQVHSGSIKCCIYVLLYTLCSRKIHHLKH